VKALHYSALALVAALALGGCSRQPPLQAAVPCVDLGGAPCAVQPPPAVDHPGPSLSGRESGAHRRRSVATARHKRARHHVADHHVADHHDVAPRQVSAATPPAASPSASGPSVQEQVAVATALADRITALSALPAPNAKERPEMAARSPAPSGLVAVLMVRPGVHAISDLHGRTVAIDERYAASHNKISSGMTAAGASEVQLIQGQGTAINRLTNGEVAAAIVALVVPEASDAFPEIAGFRIFRIPLPTI